MPIVTVQYVDNGNKGPIDPVTVGQLADRLGDIFDSDPGGTWVKMLRLGEGDYAENRTTLDPGVNPTFVEVLLRCLPDEEALAAYALAIAECVAETMNRPADNVHVIYLPEGAGRVAFGGKLIS